MLVAAHLLKIFGWMFWRLQRAQRLRVCVCVCECVSFGAEKLLYNIHHRWLSFSLKCTLVLNYLFSLLFPILFPHICAMFCFFLLFRFPLVSFSSLWRKHSVIPIHNLPESRENNLGRIWIHSSRPSRIRIPSGLVKLTLILINNNNKNHLSLSLFLDTIISPRAHRSANFFPAKKWIQYDYAFHGKIIVQLFHLNCQ